MGELNEFEQNFLLEYDQSLTLREARTELADKLKDEVAKKSFLARFMHNGNVIRKVAEAEFKKLDTKGKKTYIYDALFDWDEQKVVDNSLRVIFRTNGHGAVSVGVTAEHKASILIFERAGENERIGAFMLPNIPDTEQVAEIPDSNDGEVHEYWVSVWQKQRGYVRCRFGLTEDCFLDRHKHPLGGIWKADPDSSGPDKRVSFIWYVPKEHIASLISTVDTLDDESQAAKMIAKISFDASIATAIVSIGVAAGSIAGPAGSAAGAVAGATATLGYAIGTFVITTGAGMIAEFVAEANKYKEKLKKRIREVAGADPGSMAYGGYYSGVKLTFYENKDLSDYMVEPWNNGIMKGAPRQTGKFLEASDKMSTHALIVEITAEQ